MKKFLFSCLIAFVLLIVWLAFFDRNDFYHQYTSMQKLKKIEQDKEYYNREIIKAKEDIHELMSNPANLEKFAREEYLMKRDNEDIYVFVNSK